MTLCSKCGTKIVKQLWIVDEDIYCSPFCERSEWDKRERKWTTKYHKQGDFRVNKFGLAGLKEEKKQFDRR
jgi:hypothetical protein